MMVQHSNRLLRRDEVGILINSAGLAPSMHNTQPWRFEINGPVIDVILDQERALPAEDRSGRMIQIGLGAATFNLRVAAAMLGYESTFAPEPDPDRPDIAIRVFLSGRQTPIPPLSGLYGELRRRHTYRGPMLAAPVSPRLTDIPGAPEAFPRPDLWLDPDDAPWHQDAHALISKAVAGWPEKHLDVVPHPLPPGPSSAGARPAIEVRRSARRRRPRTI